ALREARGQLRAAQGPAAAGGARDHPGGPATGRARHRRQRHRAGARSPPAGAERRPARPRAGRSDPAGAARQALVMDAGGADWAEPTLRGIASAPADRLDLGEAALALASLERQQVDLVRYRDHLSRLGEDVAACAAGGADNLAARATALNDTILG